MSDEINIKKDEISADLGNLSAEEVWKLLYDKELNTKKNILEYIEVARKLVKQGASSKLMEDTYKLIYDSIQELGSTVKVNTKVYLINQLKSQLGRYAKEAAAIPQSCFLEFFKKAYPPQKRNKEYTYVLTDINAITDEQIWTTLTYINAWCMKDNILGEDQKNEVIRMIKHLVSRSNLKHINNVRSLERLLEELNVKIANSKDGFVVRTKAK